MNIMNILWAVLVLGGIGALFGLLLTFTSKLFAVPVDPKRDAVRACLPGANCGGCGYPGCDGCADAIAGGKAPVEACPVGGPEVAKQIAGIMGVSVDLSERKVAHVICQGGTDHCAQVFEHRGIQDCVAASLVAEGNKACKYACQGYGNCLRSAPSARSASTRRRRSPWWMRTSARAAASASPNAPRTCWRCGWSDRKSVV